MEKEERLILKNIKKCKSEIINGKIEIGFDILVGLCACGYGIYAIVESIKGKSIIPSGNIFTNISQVLLAVFLIFVAILDFNKNGEDIYDNELKLEKYNNIYQQLTKTK